MTAAEPRVSVITPVYNCAEYLAECVESVLAQTYRNWELHIIDNCSTDGSAAIADRYAAAHPGKVYVHHMTEFLPIIENHNRALLTVSPEAKYVKLLFADDWLFPTCLTQMVGAAEGHGSVGLVCCYAIEGEQVLWQGIPYGVDFVPGRQLCRNVLLTGKYVFGTATSQLYRADLVRERRPFYDPRNTHADYEACFTLLADADFAFVHQVLAGSRRRAGSNDDEARKNGSHMLGTLTVLLKYGPDLLTEQEMRGRLNARWQQYYDALARNLLHFPGRKFWRYHVARLEDLGCRLEKVRLAVSTAKAGYRSLLHRLGPVE